MATQPRHGFERAPGHVEDSFGAALAAKRRRPDRTEHMAPVQSVGRVAPSDEGAPKPVVWQQPSRPRTSVAFWHRGLLRLLGVSYVLQNMFLDDHRWSVTVTSHAIEKAGERYREGNPAVIVADVADAIANKRLASRAPHRSSSAWGHAKHAWTEDGSKTYVVRRARRAWIVITALPLPEVTT